MATILHETVAVPAPDVAGQHEERLAGMERKLDALAESVAALAEQIRYLTGQAVVEAERRDEWDELRADLTPVAREMYSAAVEQLLEIQDEFALEDGLRLLKRLARNARMLDGMLDQLESAADFWRDVSPLTSEMVAEMVRQLAEMEQKGYFGFARQGAYVLDQIVTSFGEQDVKLLGDNIVLILNTIKALTQPEMMNLMQNLTQGYHEVEEEAAELPITFVGLMKQMRDPEVRRGLAVTMAMMKKVSQQHRASDARDGAVAYHQTP